MKKFALIGAAGFIAPRHMRAIKETGNLLVAALDKSDSVGILDSYFPDASFFVEFERFDRHLEKLRQEKDERVDYVSICSPNYLHDAHIRFALRIGANAVCEKPLVMNPWNAGALQKIEKETGKRIETILQLRLHPSIVALKKRIEASPVDRRFDVELTYVTPRGRWYLYSWKGDKDKSGGIATNIGIHFFDTMCWVFGAVKENIVHVSEPTKAAGFLELERARVRWFLSTDALDLPSSKNTGALKSYRSIKIQDEEIEFSDVFSDLHTQSYVQILEGKGFGVSDALPSIETVAAIRNTSPIGIQGEYHPFLARK